MSKQGELNGYIARVRRTLQLRAGLRGAAILFGAALLYTGVERPFIALRARQGLRTATDRADREAKLDPAI